MNHLSALDASVFLGHILYVSLFAMLFCVTIFGFLAHRNYTSLQQQHQNSMANSC